MMIRQSERVETGKREEFRDQCVRVSRDDSAAFECLHTELYTVLCSTFAARMEFIRLYQKYV
jgi:hypothetical protein